VTGRRGRYRQASQYLKEILQNLGGIKINRGT
jgi:hypothetical protein